MPLLIRLPMPTVTLEARLCRRTAIPRTHSIRLRGRGLREPYKPRQAAKGVAATGVNGSAAAGQTANGDKYAAANGNVYKNTGSGWQQTQGQKPTQNYSSASSSAASRGYGGPEKSERIPGIRRGWRRRLAIQGRERSWRRKPRWWRRMAQMSDPHADGRRILISQKLQATFKEHVQVRANPSVGRVHHFARVAVFGFGLSLPVSVIALAACGKSDKTDKRRAAFSRLRMTQVMLWWRR